MGQNTGKAITYHGEYETLPAKKGVSPDPLGDNGVRPRTIDEIHDACERWVNRGERDPNE